MVGKLVDGWWSQLPVGTPLFFISLSLSLCVASWHWCEFWGRMEMEQSALVIVQLFLVLLRLLNTPSASVKHLPSCVHCKQCMYSCKGRHPSELRAWVYREQYSRALLGNPVVLQRGGRHIAFPLSLSPNFVAKPTHSYCCNHLLLRWHAHYHATQWRGKNALCIFLKFSVYELRGMPDILKVGVNVSTFARVTCSGARLKVRFLNVDYTMPRLLSLLHLFC